MAVFVPFANGRLGETRPAAGRSPLAMQLSWVGGRAHVGPRRQRAGLARRSPRRTTVAKHHRVLNPWNDLPLTHKAPASTPTPSQNESPGAEPGDGSNN
jgi:hypothetical protein